MKSTIEEKTKEHDETIERVKKLYGNGITEKIFPKIKESKDKITHWMYIPKLPANENV